LPHRSDQVRGLRQRLGVEIEHRLGVGLITGGRLVAGQHQEIADPERRRAHEVALQPDAVAVPAGQLQDRLNPGVMQDSGRCQRAHVGARAGAVGDIDSVYEGLAARPCAEIARIARHRRHHFRGHDEAPGTQARLRARLGGIGHCGMHFRGWVMVEIAAHLLYGRPGAQRRGMHRGRAG
jgi:hypothetical protein